MSLTSKEIGQVFADVRCDKFDHGYHIPYSSVFQNDPTSLLEIGVESGKSLSAWRLLFPKSKIYGIDISKKKFDPFYIRQSRAEIILGDSTSIEFCRGVKCEFDYIIDDGSHFYQDIIQTFLNFKNKFKFKYVIEDVFYNLEKILQVIHTHGFKTEVFMSKKYTNKKVGFCFAEFDTKIKDDKQLNVDLYMIIVSR